MLELEPAGADAELRATTAHDVERGDDLREQRRVAVRVAGDERAEPHGARLARERAERRVALEHVGVGLAEHRQLVEVVHQQDGVEAGPVGGRGLRGDRVEEVGRARRPGR